MPLVIAGSMLAGLAVAIVLVVGPAGGAQEHVITGSVLLAFGFGWALMALLTARLTDQPQRWAVVPAAYMVLVGLGLLVLAPSAGVMDALGWVWPPVLLALVIWMIVQVRRALHGRSRWLLYPILGVLALMAVGGGLQTLTENLDRGAHPMTGQLIDVGGHRLYIECTGSGAPAVVLQSGLGESSSYWGRIAPVVAASTTVCVYDRAGHGRSEEAAGPQDGIALSTDLHTLLERAGVAGPYVLVGHSSGGPYVRVFAARYPDQVAGMALLDAQPADAFTALPDYPAFYQTYRIVTALSPSLARVGLLGLVLGLPADQSTAASARGVRDEVIALPAALQQALAPASLGDRPLIVVTAGTGRQAGWLTAQDRMTGLSTQSVHLVIAAATHDSLITGADAAASTQAIIDVVESVRSGTPLR